MNKIILKNYGNDKINSKVYPNFIFPTQANIKFGTLKQSFSMLKNN